MSTKKTVAVADLTTEAREELPDDFLILISIASAAIFGLIVCIMCLYIMCKSGGRDSTNVASLASAVEGE